jgi:glucokinase
MENITFESTINPTLQEKINRSIIFHYIRNNKNVTRAKISRDLKISGPTVSRIIERLVRENYVIETESLISKVGKRPIKLEINPEKGFVVGVDLAKENLKVAITNFKEEMVKKYQGFTFTGDKYKNLNKLIRTIDEFLSDFKDKNIQEGQSFDLKAISVALPASTDIKTGLVIDSPTFEEWKDLDIIGELGRAFRVPIYVENDVNLSVLGEKRYGIARDYENVIFIEVSKGVGAGIIINNHLFKGSTGLAGEIECMITNPKNLESEIKDKRWLSKNASFHSIKDRAKHAIGKGRESAILGMVDNDMDKIDSLTVCEAAQGSDTLAREIIEDMIKILSIAVINCTLLINPQIIVIGGELSNIANVNELFIEPIKIFMRKSIPYDFPEIVLTKLGENAGILGASFFAIESLLVGNFPYTINLNMY